MDTTKTISVGQIVKSIAGRDKGRVFVVMDIIDDEYVLISDGDLRKSEKAKKKKIKHLAKYNIVNEEIKSKIINNEKLDNMFIRRELEKLGQ